MSEQTENFIPYVRDTYSEEEMKVRSQSFYEFMDKRRTVREFSDKPVPREVIDHIIMTASTAPSGAHKQPWTFCVVSNPEVKKKIREAAEAEEEVNYNGRMSDEWLKDLEPFATNEHKPFLEIAPYLIVVFKRVFETEEEHKKKNNYYVNESVGLAGGFLLAAIHHAGLVALTHTPSPMNFLSNLLDRPANERAFLLIPVGYPADNPTVPDLTRKGKEDVIVYYD
ncbi:nitroreductase family protein [Microscilla marina]|uniref:Iodotyrosine dehalogenase protein n=1 Tax=Microscilla marina ATCC 23134 TaxID=313606 RepID=A1ZXC0_MICM2|nr:nitroreductase family protein [Microscilla marina]EAY24994.1 iodotyrosine dehalogenase protein [Microscilla marina ATCC 23134]